jgi:hypothetical protein
VCVRARLFEGVTSDAISGSGLEWKKGNDFGVGVQASKFVGKKCDATGEKKSAWESGVTSYVQGYCKLIRTTDGSYCPSRTPNAGPVPIGCGCEPNRFVTTYFTGNMFCKE